MRAMFKRLSAGLLVLGLLGGAAVVFESTLVDAEESGAIEEVKEAPVQNGEEPKYPPVKHECELEGENPPWIQGHLRGESPQKCVPKVNCRIFWKYMMMEDGLGSAVGAVKVNPIRDFPCEPPCDSDFGQEYFPELCCPPRVIRLAGDLDAQEREYDPCRPPPPPCYDTIGDKVDIPVSTKQLPVQCCEVLERTQDNLVVPCFPEALS